MYVCTCVYLYVHRYNIIYNQIYNNIYTKVYTDRGPVRTQHLSARDYSLESETARERVIYIYIPVVAATMYEYTLYIVQGTSTRYIQVIGTMHIVHRTSRASSRLVYCVRCTMYDVQDMHTYLYIYRYVRARRYYVRVLCTCCAMYYVQVRVHSTRYDVPCT